MATNAIIRIVCVVVQGHDRGDELDVGDVLRVDDVLMAFPDDTVAVANGEDGGGGGGTEIGALPVRRIDGANGVDVTSLVVLLNYDDRLVLSSRSAHFDFQLHPVA